MKIIAEGLAFPEGPVVMADRSPVVVEIAGGRITPCRNGRKLRWSGPGLRLNFHA